MVETMQHYNEYPNPKDEEGLKYTYVSDTKYNTNDEKEDEHQDMASVQDNVGMASDEHEGDDFSFAFVNEDEKDKAESDKIMLQMLQDELLAMEKKAFEQVNDMD